MISFLYLSTILTLMVSVLLRSQIAAQFALNGLMYWFQKMIPALFPFMVFSQLLIRLQCIPMRNKKVFVIASGFLCGFPLGAKLVADLYDRDELSLQEAKFLLAFCNNLGPSYIIGFALPTINYQRTWIALMGLYGIPILYGMLLRLTFYRKMEMPYIATQTHEMVPSFYDAFHQSVWNAIQNIVMLGGYMILFNLLIMIPYLVTPSNYKLYAPILEITGGLHLLGNAHPVLALIMLSFGGLSCLMQTASCLCNSKLWEKHILIHYLWHKAIIILLTSIYYLLLCFFRLL